MPDGWEPAATAGTTPQPVFQEGVWPISSYQMRAAVLMIDTAVARVASACPTKHRRPSRNWNYMAHSFIFFMFI
jgi:hypothetical protein